MLMPSIFGENLFDEWMDDFDREFSETEIRCMENVARI